MSEEVVGEVNMEEVNSELLECARYGEDDDLRMLLGQYHGDVNHRDAGGNTALHRAAANGHIGCMQILLEFKAAYLENDEGNWPSHWAVQNAQPQALKFLFDNYPVDVLAKNKVGKSTLTEAFQCNNQEILGMCMTHESCTEERLLAGTKTKVKENADGEVTTSMTAADEKGDSFEEEVAANDAVTHLMNLLLESGLAPEASSSSSSSSSCASANVGDETASSTAQPARVVKVRELPITRADNPFGSDERPEDDTTGKCNAVLPLITMYLYINGIAFIFDRIGYLASIYFTFPLGGCLRKQFLQQQGRCRTWSWLWLAWPRYRYESLFAILIVLVFALLTIVFVVVFDRIQRYIVVLRRYTSPIFTILL